MTDMPPTVAHSGLRALLAGFASGEVPDIAVQGVALDSRAVRPGDLFLAVRGTRQHGLDFVQQVVAAGAAAVAYEPGPGIAPPELAVPAIAVNLLALRAGDIASRFFGSPSKALHCIGITGTDGKTSTAYLVAQALQRLGEESLYIGTLGTGRWDALAPGDHTTPDPVSLQQRLRRAADAGVKSLSMEVSSHALDQERIGGVHFHTAILTNVGRDHLDYHGTIERYAAAKRKLFDRNGPEAAVLNRDDAHGAAWAQQLARHRAVTLYGLDGDAPHAARYLIGRRLKLAVDGISFEVESHAGRAALRTRLLGRFNAYNLLAALAALLERGIAIDAACAALGESATVPGRIELFRGPKAAAGVVVDYAHTPQALAQVLQAVRAHCGGMLWVVFGCGGDRDRGKRPLMGAAAAQYADRVIVTDDNPRNEDPAAIVAEIRKGFPGGCKAEVVHDRARAIEQAVRGAAANDVVVIAGKGHEDTQQYGAERRKFSDRVFVAGLTGDTRKPPSGEARGQG